MRSYQTVHGKKRDAIRIMNQIVAGKERRYLLQRFQSAVERLAGSVVPRLLCRPSGENHPVQLPGQDRPLHRTSAWKYPYRKD